MPLSRRNLFLLLSPFAAASLLPGAATIRLYMKDGEFHLVREYQVVGDRVKFYSVERGDWEEIPLELVDLKKTKATVEQSEAETKKLADAEREEAAAEREARREVESIPAEPGAYWITGKGLETLAVAEVSYTVDKKRRLLKALSPVPMVAGKAVLEIDGETSARVIREERPEFYFRLAREERSAIIRLNPGQGKDKKKTRIVEKINIIPVVNEITEELDEVESFRRQVGDLVFKIWPTKPLAPGEYALIEYSPAVGGKYSLQVWDFSVQK